MPPGEPVPPPPPPGQVPYVPPPATSSGALVWALGLLVLICIPFVSSVVACVVMIAVGRSGGDRGPVGSANARNAANWAITYLCGTVVLVGVHFGLLFAFTRDEPVEGFFPLGIPITVWVIWTVAHLVICIVGMIKATRRKVFAPPALPVFRR
jgi:hypothetical protein